MLITVTSITKQHTHNWTPLPICALYQLVMGNDSEHYLPLVSTPPHEEEGDEEHGETTKKISRTQSKLTLASRLSRREYVFLVVILLQLVVIAGLATRRFMKSERDTLLYCEYLIMFIFPKIRLCNSTQSTCPGSRRVRSKSVHTGKGAQDNLSRSFRWSW